MNHHRISPPVEREQAAEFASRVIAEANHARELRASRPDPQVPGTSPLQFLSMASMYLGRAIYYTVAGNSQEAVQALLQSAATLFEAWAGLVEEAKR